MKQNKVLPLSVVIASLGHPKLFKTLKSLDLGKFLPKEVIIILPPHQKMNNVNSYKFKISVKNSPKKGQVSQRCFGFKYCSQNYIMQSDDDMIFKSDTLLQLFQNLKKLGKKNIVGPVYLNINNHENITKIKTGFYGLFFSIFHTCICMAPWSVKRMGYLTKTGMGYGIDPSKLKSNRPFQVGWLNGGAVMCHVDDLILEDYFPFEGKSYFEDTIHSILWKKNKNSLFVIPKAICLQEKDNNLSLSIDAYIDKFKVHKYVVKLLNGNLFMLYIWQIIFIIKLLFIRITNVFKN